MNCEIMLADEAGDSPVEERTVAAPSVTLEMMAAVINTVGSGSEVETLLPALLGDKIGARQDWRDCSNWRPQIEYCGARATDGKPCSMACENAGLIKKQSWSEMPATLDECVRELGANLTPINMQKALCRRGIHTRKRSVQNMLHERPYLREAKRTSSKRDKREGRQNENEKDKL